MTRRAAIAAALICCAAAPILIWLLVVRGGAFTLALGAGLASPAASGPAAVRFRAPERWGGDADAGPIPPALIWVVGTSLTARGDWPERLAEALFACRGAPVALRRIARPGAGSAWGAPALASATQEVANGAPAPDAVVIEFAINDASLVHGVALSRSRDQHMKMLSALAALPSPPATVFALTGPAWGREAWERPGLPAYFDMLRALSARRGIVLIDLGPAWRSLPTSERRRLAPDGLHPTDEGMARTMTPAVLAALRPALCAQGAQP